MKYLKLYESYEERVNLTKLLKFCKDNLPYLIDDKFTISIGKWSNDIAQISIRLNEPPFRFTWESVKADFLPFLELLRMNYEIDDEVCFITDVSHKNIYIKGGYGKLGSGIEDYYYSVLFDDDFNISDNISIVSIKFNYKWELSSNGGWY